MMSRSYRAVARSVAEKKQRHPRHKAYAPPPAALCPECGVELGNGFGKVTQAEGSPLCMDCAMDRELATEEGAA